MLYNYRDGCGLKRKSPGLPYNIYWTASFGGSLVLFSGATSCSLCLILYLKLLSFIMRFFRINVSSWILLCTTSMTADASSGSIGFYADSSCLKQVNNTQNVAAGACVNTKGVIAVAALSLPSCGHTTAILYVSDIASCKDPSFLPLVSSGNVGDCLSFIEGRLIDSAHFQCNSSADETGNTPDPTNSGQPGDPTPSDSPPNDEPGSGGSSLSLGTTLGIVFGVVSAIASVIGVTFRIIAYRKSRTDSRTDTMYY
ncbi:hypothetical protein F4777DRAFT_586158 [Nemania sp. FL0916]|nr:hypothetical protein F4777DRAFT_586158 [Nemania sp. FL0916]